MLSIIVATDLNSAIGRKNELLWHISEDLKYFKSVTQGNPVIMGRKTYESIGRPLPKRENIVLTSKELVSPVIKPGSETSFVVKQSLKEVIDLAKLSDKEYFIIGGGEIYRQAFPFADRLYITKIYSEAKDPDTYFPTISDREWCVIKRSGKIHDEENNIDFEFIIYNKDEQR